MAGTKKKGEKSEILVTAQSRVITTTKKRQVKEEADLTVCLSFQIPHQSLDLRIPLF